MVVRLTATQVIREATSGRTKPLIVSCHTPDGQTIEVFCKLSEGCEAGVLGLAMEVVAACVAILLELPVPNPSLVDLPTSLVALAQDQRIGSRIRDSSKVAFGSKSIPGPVPLWHKGSKLAPQTIQVALGAFVFDAVIGNADRRPKNPNCFDSDRGIWLIDHELTFPRNLIGDQLSPWELGGLQWLCGQDQHIFRKELRRLAQSLDFDHVAQLWAKLSDGRLERIRQAVPVEWNEALPAVDDALERVRQARSNMNAVISEVRRVLQ